MAATRASEIGTATDGGDSLVRAGGDDLPSDVPTAAGGGDFGVDDVGSLA